MADKDTSMAVEDPVGEVPPTDSGSGTDADKSEATDLAPTFSYDEQTLGRSESVFDAGVDLNPPVVPPIAPSIGPALGGVPGMGPAAGTVQPPIMHEPAPERPLSTRERRRRVRLEARRVRRVVRHIEPWSVLKISILFYFCLWLIFMLAGVLLWSFAARSGTLESIEELVEDLFALDESGDFWRGDTIFRAYAIGTLVLSVAGITFNVLLCVLYNLISDLTGGIRVMVIEEESARFTPPRRRHRR